MTTATVRALALPCRRNFLVNFYLSAFAHVSVDVYELSVL